MHVVEQGTALEEDADVARQRPFTHDERERWDRQSGVDEAKAIWPKEGNVALATELDERGLTFGARLIGLFEAGREHGDATHALSSAVGQNGEGVLGPGHHPGVIDRTRNGRDR